MAALVGERSGSRSRASTVVASLAAAVVVGACAQAVTLHAPTPELLATTAPDSFIVEVETSEGSFRIRMRRAWSPLAVDRVFVLMDNDFYAGARIYRMVPGFVAQFGFTGDPVVDSVWRDHGLEDEPVLASNERGVVSFARGGPRTRSYTLFINLEDNTRLDSLPAGGVVGYPPIGVLESDVDIVEGFYSAYDMPGSVQDSIRILGNDFLRREYPQLDSIVSTRIVAWWG